VQIGRIAGFGALPLAMDDGRLSLTTTAPQAGEPMTDLLDALVVDDERPVLDELEFLLRRDLRIGDVHTAASGAAALRLLEAHRPDVVFIDVVMPMLSGLDLAHVLTRFKDPPKIVFVTAHDAHAVDAFELNAVDYLLKPVREERLSEAIRRVVESHADTEPSDDETIPVERGGVTRFIRRAEVRYVEAHGDYARLHTGDDSHLIRVPLTTLEEEWAEAGFVRIHRSLLVSTNHLLEVRNDSGSCSVVVDLGDGAAATLRVARRHTRELRDLLVRQAHPRHRTASP
jgi:DNA-binding LytR/AlgR family response regulator